MRAIAPLSLAISRARYTEDFLEKAVRAGVRQYLILGAGMDSFAFRCPELVKELQVFEVDHPATQAHKRSRLAEVGWPHPVQLHFVPVDFNHESPAAALARSSYNTESPSFFSWLGVTYYLNREAVISTLRAVAGLAPAGSTIIFDYLDNDAFLSETAARSIQVGMEYLRNIGEPMITGFEPSALAEELAPLGLRLLGNLSPADIEKRFFRDRTDGYHAYEHMHFARAVVDEG
jgi:methyltransferase (TIGR00027 family)